MLPMALALDTIVAVKVVDPGSDKLLVANTDPRIHGEGVLDGPRAGG